MSANGTLSYPMPDLEHSAPQRRSCIRSRLNAAPELSGELPIHFQGM